MPSSWSTAVAALSACRTSASSKWALATASWPNERASQRERARAKALADAARSRSRVARGHVTPSQIAAKARRQAKLAQKALVKARRDAATRLAQAGKGPATAAGQGKAAGALQTLAERTRMMRAMEAKGAAARGSSSGAGAPAPSHRGAQTKTKPTWKKRGRKFVA